MLCKRLPFQLDQKMGSRPISKWEEQERRRRVQRSREAERSAAKISLESQKSQAEEDTRDAQDRIKEFENILKASLAETPMINWRNFVIIVCSTSLSSRYQSPIETRFDRIYLGKSR